MNDRIAAAVFRNDFVFTNNNRFDWTKHRPAEIARPRRSEWDFDESSLVNILDNPSMRAINRGDGKTAPVTIWMLSNYIYSLRSVVEAVSRAFHKPLVEDNLYSGVRLLLDTDVQLSEIPAGTQFEGMNKPRHMVMAPNDSLTFKTDNKYRAGLRSIFLTIRKNMDSDKMMDWIDVRSTLLHELAHTMCNHVIYREEGNHEEDFDKAERFLNWVADGFFLEELDFAMFEFFKNPGLIVPA